MGTVDPGGRRLLDDRRGEKDVSALDVFLAIVGVGVTALVIAGMVLLEPHHLVSRAPETDLSDVKPRALARPNIHRPTATEPGAERTRREPAMSRGDLTEEDRTAGPFEIRQPPMDA